MGSASVLPGIAAAPGHRAEARGGDGGPRPRSGTRRGPARLAGQRGSPAWRTSRSAGSAPGRGTRRAGRRARGSPTRPRSRAARPVPRDRGSRSRSGRACRCTTPGTRPRRARLRRATASPTAPRSRRPAWRGRAPEDLFGVSCGPSRPAPVTTASRTTGTASAMAPRCRRRPGRRSNGAGSTITAGSMPGTRGRRRRRCPRGSRAARPRPTRPGRGRRSRHTRAR